MDLPLIFKNIKEIGIRHMQAHLEEENEDLKVWDDYHRSVGDIGQIEIFAYKLNNEKKVLCFHLQMLKTVLYTLYSIGGMCKCHQN